jgi:hypothetical protein
METDDEWQSRMDEGQHGRFYDDFAGRYWHCTRWRSFRAIMEHGAIVPNTGQFKVSYSQTSISYAYREGRIAIFDFVAPARREILAHAFKWTSFLYGFRPISVALELDPIWVDHRIIRAADVTEPITANTLSYRFPVVEAWIRETVPFAAITAVHFLASHQTNVIIEKPLTLERLEAGRVDLTQRVRQKRRQDSPNGGLELVLRCAERAKRRPR